MLPVIVLIVLSACSVGNRHPNLGVQSLGPAVQLTPAGTFVGPTVVGPAVKLRLNPDGTYIAEDIGPPEFWTLAEGNRFYPEPIKFRPQVGHWAWNHETGELTLIAEAPDCFRWDLRHLRFSSVDPNRLAWGGGFLERQDVRSGGQNDI